MNSKKNLSKQLYDIVILENFKMPERSRLPQLAPIGLGTSMVESLTSYLNRQAEAHSVTCATLIKDGLSTDFKKLDTSWYNTYSPIINGVGEAAATFIRATEESTHLSGLEYLTLRPFKDVLPVKGLVSDRLRWCPECYSQWLSENKPIYNPLIWHLKAVQVCPIHKVHLCECCPSCSGILPVIPRRPYQGYCPYCEAFLGLLSEQKKINDNTSPELHDWKCWIANTIGELFANAKEYSPRSKKKIFLSGYETTKKNILRGRQNPLPSTSVSQ